MDYAEYRKHLRYTREDDLVDRYIQMAESLQQFLEADGHSIGTLTEATPDDLRRFEATQDQTIHTRHWRYRYLDALFRFLDDTAMVAAVQTLNADAPIPAALKLFRTTPLSHRRALEAHGIADNLQLLEVSRTSEDRLRLARKAGIPIEGLRTLVRISDLRRLVGLRRVYALMEAGIETPRQVAALSPRELFDKVQNAHPKRKLDFRGYEPLPFRAGFLPQMVEGL